MPQGGDSSNGGGSNASRDGTGWLDLVLRLERAVGSQVEQVVRSDAYFELNAQLTRHRKRAAKLVQGVQEEWLHVFNLPASTDIRRLREQLGRLEREVADLTLELADRRESEAAVKTRPTGKRTPRA